MIKNHDFTSPLRYDAKPYDEIGLSCMKITFVLLRYLRIIPIVLISLLQTVHAQELTIAAAADLKFALDKIIEQFKQCHQDDKVTVVYGSSGKFHTQIMMGAPYDLFFSADIELPRKLKQQHLAASEVIPYAYGRLVLWSADRDASKMDLSSLTDPSIRHIAIANPKHAPYGQRAVDALKSAAIWQQIEPKLVYGENIAQTAQLVQSGNAQVGIIALSLALSPTLSKRGGYWLIPDTLHPPLEQGYIITSRAHGNHLAHEFADFMHSEAATAIMAYYGFTIPTSS